MRMVENEECGMCMEEFVAPCKITVLACNENHYFHQECIDQWVEFNTDKGVTATCPMCRKDIDPTAMIKREMKEVMDQTIDQLEGT